MRRLMLSVASFALILGLNACDDDDTETLTASLAASNEVPPTASTATGTATFEVDGTTIRYEIRVNGGNAITAAHIHSGAAGVNGPVRVPLFTGATTGAISGVLSSGTFTAAEVQGITFDALLAEMRAGNAYANVHSTTYPGGEIRAQIRVE
jgi:hypothetical protein